MIQKFQKKWLFATLLFLLIFTGISFAQTNTEFHFTPGWQQGDEAIYQNEATLQIDVKEIPLYSGLWGKVNYDQHFQVLRVSKKSTRIEKKVLNGTFTSPMLSSLSLPSENKGKIKSYLEELSGILSSLREDYEINPEGKLIRIHNGPEQLANLDKLIDLIGKYLPSTEATSKQLETIKKNYRNNFKTKVNPPLDQFGIHNSLIYNKNFTIGSTTQDATDLDIPQNPTNGAKGIKLSVPKEVRVERTPQGILVTEIHRLDNEWTGEAMKEIIRWTDPKKADELISSWNALKMLGVSAYSDTTVTSTYLFGTNSQWPEEMSQKVEWDFNTDIRSIKKAGGKEMSLYPDTLTIKTTIQSTSKLKQTESHDDTSPETEIQPDDNE